VAFFNEEIQVRINGSNIFPKSGLTKDMERMGHVVDSWGECFAFPGSNMYDIDVGEVVGDDAADGRAQRGTLSYNGWYVGEKVLDLQIVHSRTGLNDTSTFRPTTSSCNVIYFGEVKKGLVVTNDGYNISYI